MSFSNATLIANGSEPVYGMPSISQTAGTLASRERLVPTPSAKLNTKSGGSRNSASNNGLPSPISTTSCPKPRNTSPIARMVTGESNSSCRSSGAPGGSGSSGFKSKAMPIFMAKSRIRRNTEKEKIHHRGHGEPQRKASELILILTLWLSVPSVVSPRLKQKRAGNTACPVGFVVSTAHSVCGGVAVAIGVTGLHRQRNDPARRRRVMGFFRFASAPGFREDDLTAAGHPVVAFGHQRRFVTL